MIRFAPERLRQARVNAGIRPERLAIAVDRSSYTIFEYERGRVQPSAAMLAILANAIGVSVADFFVDDEERASRVQSQRHSEQTRRSPTET